MYARALRIDVARPLSRRFIRIFSLGALVWLASVAVPEPWRYVLWAVALIIEVGPVYIRSTRQMYAAMPLSESHFPERMGLFTIIVLGESVAGIVAGLAGQDYDPALTGTAALGLLVAFGVWWVYFTNLEGSVLQGIGGWSVVAWVYSHFPLMMGLTALGIGVEHAVAEGAGHALAPAVVWLLAGSLACAYTAIAVIHFAMASSPVQSGSRRKGVWRLAAAASGLIAGLVVIAAGGWPIVMVALMSVVSLSQVAGDLLGLDAGGTVRADAEQESTSATAREPVE